MLQACKTLTEQIAALKGSPAPFQAAQQKTAELEEDKAKFHLHISSLEVGRFRGPHAESTATWR